MKNFLLVLLMMVCFGSNAQTETDDLAITLGVSAMPLFNDHNDAFDMSVRYYLTDQFSIGGNFYTSSPKFTHGFGFATDRTLINMYAISVPLQYEVINANKFSLGFGFSNGVLINVLRDRNQTTPQDYWDSDTGIGTSWDVPLKLGTNTFYVVTPYAEASYKLLSLDRSEDLSLFLTGKAGYQNVLGSGSFSKAKDFTDYIISIGITIKGTTK